VNSSGTDTPGIRAALASANLLATFFIVGTNAYKHPEEVLANYKAGHHLALHTWTRMLNST
jgi:peptidoglycan/xylan/chitin deacetylase (PgdA/CDA1 family)